MTRDRRKNLFASLAVALLVLPLLPAISGDQADDAVPPEWWPRERPAVHEWGSGFHLRVPITVKNHLDSQLRDAPVAAQLDLAEVLFAAGWTGGDLGQGEVFLESFDLDLDSIRVINMTNLNPQEHLTDNGLMSKHNDDLPATDPARYEVPSIVVPDFLDRSRTRAFDPENNPILTVVWIVKGNMEPGEERHYMVYLDTLTNIDHEAPAYEGVDRGQLDSLYWGGPRSTIYGFAPKEGSGPTTVRLWGLHDDTQVTIFTQQNDVFRKLPSTGESPNPLQIDADQSKEVLVASGSRAIFKLEATQPILAYVDSHGFVPSLDKGYLGNHFFFDQIDTEPRSDTIYFINPSIDDAVAEVRPVDGGPTHTFELPSKSLGHYTIGARANAFTGPGSDCQPQEGGNTAPLLPQNADRYEATVTGAPVMLQMQPRRDFALYQVPSGDGAPVGQEHWAAVSWTHTVWTSVPNGSPFCDDDSRRGDWYRAGLMAPTSGNVTSPEATFQLHPQGSEQNRFPGPASIPQAPDFSDPANINNLPPGGFDGMDRPLQFSSLDDSFLFTGVTRSELVPSVAGPLGGADMGRSFAGFGESLIIAPFNNTVVEPHIEYLASQEDTTPIPMGADQVHEILDRPGGDAVDRYTLHSNKPIFVYPTAVAPAYLAGVPLSPTVIVHGAEFRGYLVELDSPLGQEPLAGSTFSNETIVYDIVVKNNGRTWDGKGLSDTVDLSVAGVPVGWKASLDRGSVILGPRESQTVRLSVTPPPDAPSGQATSIFVEAVSSNNPQIGARLETSTFLKRNFDVGLWFETVGGPKQLQQFLGAGEQTEYELVLLNKGTTKDTFTLEASRPAQGWEAIVVQDGKGVDSITLGPRQKANLDLRVKAPEGINDGLQVTTVTATSQTSAAALDRVVARSTVRAPSDLKLVTEDPVRLVDPGKEVVFDVAASNVGLGVADVHWDLVADALPGWSDQRLFIIEPSTGNRTNLTIYPLESQETLGVKVAVRAPPGGQAGETLGIRLSAQVTGSSGALEEFLHATIRANHSVRVSVEGEPIVLQQVTEPTRIPLRLKNLGNLDEHLIPVISDLPPGWVLEMPDRVAINQNQSATVDVNLTAHPSTAPGDYNISLNLVAVDGGSIPVEFSTRVPVRATGQVGAGGEVLAQPNFPAMLRVPVQNFGNAPARVVVGPAAGEPWELVDPAERLLVPGASTTIEVAWQVPASAATGTSSHAAALHFIPQDPGAPDSIKTVSARINVDRTDLFVATADAFTGSAGTIVEASLLNLGNRPGTQVTVALLDPDGQRLDTVVVDHIPVGGSTNVSLLATGAAVGAKVVVDPDDIVKELNEDNNAVVLNADDAPTPLPWWVVLAAVVVAMRRRRGTDTVS